MRDGSEKINNEKIKEIFGLDFFDYRSFNGTTTRNNELFSIMRIIIDKDYDFLQVIPKGDRFKIIFYKKKEKSEQKSVTWKSIGSRIFDIALLDSSLKHILYHGINAKNTRKMVIKQGKINLSTAKNNFLALKNYKIDDLGEVKDIFSYWKSLDSDKIIDKFVSKIYFAIYLIFREKEIYHDENINKLIKENRMQILIDFLERYVLEFFIINNDENDKPKKDVTKPTLKKLDAYKKGLKEKKILIF